MEKIQEIRIKTSVQTNIIFEPIGWRRRWLYFQTEKPVVCFTIPSTILMTDFIMHVLFIY